MIPDTNLPLCCQAWASEQAHSSWHRPPQRSSAETSVAREPDPGARYGSSEPARDWHPVVLPLRR